MRRPLLPAVVGSLLLVSGVTSPLFGAETSGGETSAAVAQRALVECERGRAAKERDERQRYFERGNQLAERAVALDDNNAQAHFAVVCNMGELMRIDGESIRSVFALRTLMAEIDRTLELEPNHTGAMATKGTLLLRLPRLVGGDPPEGEALLRRVVSLDPHAVSSRLTLAKTCTGRGEREEAISLATRALEIARAEGRPNEVAEAETLLASLGAAR
jgi:hypothetical protein